MRGRGGCSRCGNFFLVYRTDVIGYYLLSLFDLKGAILSVVHVYKI